MRIQLKAAAAATVLLATTAALGAPSSMLHTLPEGSQAETPAKGNWLTKWFHKEPEGSVVAPQVEPTRMMAPGTVAYLPPSQPDPRLAMNSGGMNPAAMNPGWGGAAVPGAAVAVAMPYEQASLPASQPTPIGSVQPSAGAPAQTTPANAAGDSEASGDCKSLRERGHAKDREGDLAGAERLYRRAIAADPTSAAAVNDLGLCLARQGQLEPSSAVLKQAILMRPDKQLYRNNLATVLVEQGQPDEAVAQLKSVGTAATAHYNVGQLLMRSQKSDLASAQFQKALEAEPNFGPAQQALAQLRPAATFATVAATNAVTNTVAGLSKNAATTVANIAPAAPAKALPPSDDITPETPAMAGPEEAPLTGAPSFPRLLPPVLNR